MRIIILLVACLTLTSTGCGADSIEKKWFPHADGTQIKGRYIDLHTNGTQRLYVRYNQIADSGVELERTTNNGVLWRVHVRPLGVEHSLYNHAVEVRVEGDRIWVTSTGARKIFEVRALSNGALISREIEDVQK